MDIYLASQMSHFTPHTAHCTAGLLAALLHCDCNLSNFEQLNFLSYQLNWVIEIDLTTVSTWIRYVTTLWSLGNYCSTLTAPCTESNFNMYHNYSPSQNQFSNIASQLPVSPKSFQFFCNAHIKYLDISHLTDVIIYIISETFYCRIDPT